MSLKYFVENFDKDTIDDVPDIELDITKKALEKPERPILYTDFPGGRSIINLWATRERLGEALGVKPEEIVDLLAHAVDEPTPVKEVGKAEEFYEEMEQFDLRDLPIPKYYPKDGGRYITSGVVFSEYEGIRNLSFHRLMLTGKNTFTIRLVPRNLHRMYTESIEEGQELEVSIAIGVCPPILLAGATSVDYDVDEFQIASSLREKGIGEKVEACELPNGNLIPAYSEYILQGRLLDEEGDEGPFVDITSTYDKVRQQPVLKIDKIWKKEDPIFHALLPGGHEHFLLMGLPRESVMKREIEKVADVKDVRLTQGGCSWLHGVVSIKKDDRTDVDQVITKAFKAHTSMKKVTIVDDDIDIYNDQQVEWAIATRFQPHKDMTILEDQKGSSLDPSAPELTSKWALDATRPWEGEEFQRAKLK